MLCQQGTYARNQSRLITLQIQLLNSMPDVRFWLSQRHIPLSHMCLGFQHNPDMPRIQLTWNPRSPLLATTAVYYVQPHSIQEWIWLRTIHSAELGPFDLAALLHH